MNETHFAVLRERLLDRLEFFQEIQDEEIYHQIDEVIMEYGNEYYLRLTERNILRQDLFNSIRKLDILQELIEDNMVTEIMVNGTDGIFVEKDGRLIRWNKKFLSKERLEDIAQQIAGRCNRIE